MNTCRRCRAVPASVLCETCVEELDDGAQLTAAHRTGMQLLRARHPRLLERVK